MVIPENNSEALRMVAAGAKRKAQQQANEPINFYSSDVVIEDFDNVLDSSRYYNQHLDSYFDDPSPGGDTLTGESPLNLRNRGQASSHHRKIRPQT